MTSNLGSHLIQERVETMTENNRDDITGSLKLKLFEMLKQTIRPEFLNRIDEIIVFKPLTLGEIGQIVDLQLKNVQKMMAEKNMTVEISREAREWLAKLGYDPIYGARPLKRVIQKHIINLLSEKILSNEIVDGDNIKIGLNSRGLISFTKPARDVH
jgi:ATP-dependent Clp protease ATP-binding subunit ClpB